MKGRVIISPELAGAPDRYYSDYDRTLHINGLAPATDYVVRILPGMQDPYGNKINDEISKMKRCIFLRTGQSEAIQFNTLKNPTLNAEIVYNFFDEKEKPVFAICC